MDDNELIPISDAQAELAKAIVEAGKDSFGYLADILGDLPKDLVGLLVGDRVKAARAERAARLWSDAKKRLKDRGIGEPEPPPLKLALPILAAAVDENRDDLQDLWAGLLAAAMDPQRQSSFRQIFIEILKGMDPFDALVFKAIIDSAGSEWAPSGRDFVATKLKASNDEVLVSFENLSRLNVTAFSGGGGPRINPYLTSLGKLLANALA